MRAHARAGVSGAISSTYDDHEHALLISRAPPGEEAHALFDGIAEALAETIISHARPGREHNMAQLVSSLVMAKVMARTCAGHA